MTDEFKVQWSISLPPAAQYAKGHMLNLRGNTVAEVEAQLEEILAPNSEFIQKAADVAAQLVATQVVADGFKGSGETAQSAPAEDNSSSGGRFCEHGKRVRREGDNNKGHWVGWFCPLGKGDNRQCKPEWEDNK